MADSIQDIFANQGGSTAPGAKPMVYWGSAGTGGFFSSKDVLNPRTYKVSEITKTQDDAIAQFYTWSDEERAAWGQRLYKLGIIKTPDDYSGMFNAWQQAVQEAANFYTFGGRKVTPWDVVDLFSTAHGSTPTTTTRKSKSFQIPNPGDAHAAVKSIFQSALGRDPTDGELARYSSMLVAKSKANPQITNTTSTTDTSGNVSQTSTTSGGFNPSDVLNSAIENTNEYGAYQAATTYMNALLAKIGGA